MDVTCIAYFWNRFEIKVLSLSLSIYFYSHLSLLLPSLDIARMNSLKGFIPWTYLQPWLVNKMNCVGKSHYQIISLKMKNKEKYTYRISLCDMKPHHFHSKRKIKWENRKVQKRWLSLLNFTISISRLLCYWYLFKFNKIDLVFVFFSLDFSDSMKWIQYCVYIFSTQALIDVFNVLSFDIIDYIFNTHNSQVFIFNQQFFFLSFFWHPNRMNLFEILKRFFSFSLLKA